MNVGSAALKMKDWDKAIIDEPQLNEGLAASDDDLEDW